MKDNFPDTEPAQFKQDKAVPVGEQMSQATELMIRMFLWGGHGHQGIYGDDGEMQCQECGCDYKRDSLNTCVDKARIAALHTGLKNLPTLPVKVAAIERALDRLESFDFVPAHRNTRKLVLHQLLKEAKQGSLTESSSGPTETLPLSDRRS